MKIQETLNKIIDRQDLTRLEAEGLMEEMMKGKLTPSQIAAVLTALRIKGESVEEMVGFVRVMRKHMVKVQSHGLVIDTCGTGGDGKGTFNISSTAAFVVAGAGVAVAKHGNRSASSQCGSADVLEALGVNITFTPEQASGLLKTIGLTFLFAPLFHPAMKYVASVRKELKIPTVFNYLGPLVNPAGVKRQLIGVPTLEIAKKLAQVAAHLQYEHVMIVTSGDGLDEIGIFGKTHFFEVKGKTVKEGVIDPRQFGITPLKKRLDGGDAKKNAEIIRSILEGDKRDIVILNAAAVLYVSGKAKDISQGIKMAKESIDSGKAKRVLEKFIKASQNV